MKLANFDYDTLRPYQVEAVTKLQHKRNVLIGDAMGIGKTVEAIALDAVRRHQQATSNGQLKGIKTLVVCPLTGVIDSWVRHFRWLSPNLVVRRIDTSNKYARLSIEGDIFDDGVDVIIVHWQALQPRLGVLEYLQKQHWLHIIADEVHRAKNRKAQQTNGLKSLKRVDFKTGLTGTPVPNFPYDFWSILNWLFNSRAEQRAEFKYEKDQRLINSYWKFYDKFVDWYDVVGYRQVAGPRNEEKLRELIAPFYIRRTKDQALPDLPPKQYQTYHVMLGDKQRKAYDQMKKDMVAWLGEQGDTPLSAPVVIAQLIRLQQMALGYCTLTPREVGHYEDGTPIYEVNVSSLDKPSAKLDALMDIVDDAGDDKIVVFSQFSKMIDLCANELEQAGYKIGKITGNQSDKQRTDYIDRFMGRKGAPEDAPQIMLCTIGAGREGIDLYEASTAIFLDRDWVPAMNDQAEDRLHRSGQKNSVNIIDIVAVDTVDRSRGTTIQKKASWIKKMLEGEV